MMGGNQLDKDRKKIADFVDEYVKKNGYKDVYSNKELLALFEENGVKPECVFYLNSDVCYNRINDGIIDTFKTEMHLFEQVKRGYYRILGRNYPYTGDIKHKKAKQDEYVAGRWKDGVIVEWNPVKGK